jgi:hypothetical protein
MRLTTRNTTLALATLVLATALAACGSDEESDATPSSQTSVGDSSSSSDAGQGDSAENLDTLITRMREGLGTAGSAHIKTSFTGANEGEADGDIIYGDTTVSRTTMDAPPPLGKVNAIFTDEFTYLNVAGQTPKGKYGKLPNDHVVAATLRLATFDPLALVSAFEQAAETAEVIGSEEIEGEPVDHYRLVVASTPVLSELELSGSEALPELTYDVWLASDDHIRRVSVKTLVGLDLVYDWSAWGEEVDIAIPDKADIIR